ncbi:MAG: DUF402 domain-containing protein [Thermomicrobiales bacterium]|nr:DUF402 domain-containing protein [Thermomicrobiales bacterium]
MLREVRQGQIWSAKPVTVVRDTPELVALWMAPGTHWLQPRRPDGGPVGIVDVLRDAWVLADATWQGGGALTLQIPSAAHAVIGFWDDHQQLASWYLNLQAPLRRTMLGFDTLDHILDIVVSRDRRSWAWKDEAPLAEAVSRGLVTPESAHAIRAEGERALQLLLDGQLPYAPEWEQWAPDPAWGIPALPLNVD